MSAPASELRELWVHARLLLGAWHQHKEHPHCDVYQRRMDTCMRRLEAVCTLAEPALEMERKDDTDDSTDPSAAA